jgi:hypothetical protein
MTTRASAPGALPEPLGQAGPKAVGQSAAQHSAPRFLIFISFYIFRKSNELQNFVENTILIGKYETSFYGILRSISWF